MNTDAWIATVYAIGAILTAAFILSMAPEHDAPGLATRKVIIVRTVILAVQWPFVLVVFVVTDVFPKVGDWILHGR